MHSDSSPINRSPVGRIAEHRLSGPFRNEKRGWGNSDREFRRKIGCAIVVRFEPQQLLQAAFREL